LLSFAEISNGAQAKACGYQKQRTLIALLCVLASLALASGCGVQQLARGEFQPPKIHFQGLTVYQPTSQGWPLAANLALDNPNNQQLNLLGYNYDLQIEGRTVAQGTAQQAVNLPPLGRTVTQFPILVQLPTVLNLLPGVLQHPKRKLHYQISGSFRLGSVIGGLIPIPFRFAGEMAPQEGMDFVKPYMK
jgi:LEA14-like dessication related protein